MPFKHNFFKPLVSPDRCSNLFQTQGRFIDLLTIESIDVKRSESKDFKKCFTWQLKIKTEVGEVVSSYFTEQKAYEALVEIDKRYSDLIKGMSNDTGVFVRSSRSFSR